MINYKFKILILKTYLVIILIFISSSLFSQTTVRFAVIGDYGKWSTGGEALVSEMVHSWNPEFILTLGDNNYEEGADSTIDSNIGQFYHDYIFPYNGIFGQGAPFNKFFPAMGNHDWIAPNAQPYLNYFTLPNNERYYNFIKWNCEFFAINSDINEPDGYTENSIQGTWLRTKLSQSNAHFKIVYFHHPPYSSGQHGSTAYMQWPFKNWGATVVLSGHEHNYERLVSDDLTYFVNGLGGKEWRDSLAIIPESRKWFTGNFGAMYIVSYRDSINFKFYSVPDILIDDTTFNIPQIGIEPISTEIPANYNLFQNYPNPFNPVTKIQFAVPAESIRERTILKIFDILGKEIETLVNEELNPGKYEVQWNAATYSSGVYFYRLTAGDVFFSKKMVLTK